jgi:hypothetical protein
VYVSVAEMKQSRVLVPRPAVVRRRVTGFRSKDQLVDACM